MIFLSSFVYACFLFSLVSLFLSCLSTLPFKRLGPVAPVSGMNGSWLGLELPKNWTRSKQRLGCSLASQMGKGKTSGKSGGCLLLICFCSKSLRCFQVAPLVLFKVMFYFQPYFILKRILETPGIFYFLKLFRCLTHGLSDVGPGFNQLLLKNVSNFLGLDPLLAGF